MPSGAMTKRLVLVSGLALAVLLIVGFVVGAIGSAMFGREAPFVSKPEIHLPPQPIFPASVRDQQLGLTPDAEKAAETQEGAGETAGHDEAAGWNLRARRGRRRWGRAPRRTGRGDQVHCHQYPSFSLVRHVGADPVLLAGGPKEKPGAGTLPGLDRNPGGRRLLFL